MKKLFYIPAVLAFAVFAACGPSAAEKKAKHAADSTRVADSVAAVNKAAEDARLAEEAAKAQAAADSTAKAQHVADSVAATAKAPKKGK